MGIILNINTALETAFIILSKNTEIVAEAQSDAQKDHASFLESSIKKICTEAGISLNEIDAVAVVNGPGSYTGLRVALASAKGLCYALKKPLILLNTLDVMAYALKLQSPINNKNILFCPLIDARRMEVYTALYNSDLLIIKNYTAEILNELFLQQERKTNIIIAGGSGSIKMNSILHDENIVLVSTLLLRQPMAILSHQAFNNQTFSALAYSEPFYLKPVYFRNK